MWAEGAASSGGNSGVAEVSRRGGAEGSRRAGPDIWNSGELEKSWKERTCSGEEQEEKEERQGQSTGHQATRGQRRAPEHTLTLSLLAPGRDRSWSECRWFQPEPVGPDRLRPTTG